METLFTQNTHIKMNTMFLITASNKDIASLTIKNQLLNYYQFTETPELFQQNPMYWINLMGKKIVLVTLNKELVDAQNLPENFPYAKLIIFISRHSSQSGKPTLSVHTPGNFAEAGLGGLPRIISVSPATAMREALIALQQQKKRFVLDYEVSYECTHHGPSLNKPAMFVELGSSELQWYDQKAAQAVAHAAMSAITHFHETASSALLGIGGPHYNQKFTQMALSGEAIFSHMIPKYAVSTINSAMLSQCREKTLENVPSAVLDWKGIKSEDKPKLLEALRDAELSFEKV
jgi:D-aminoacyl-tRNA deacylase